MSRKDEIIVHGRRRGTGAKWVLGGILIFLTIYMPFFGINLQYQVGSFLYLLCSKLGELCVWGGWILLAFAILGGFFAKKVWIKTMILGIVLLWVGSCLTGQTFELFNFMVGPDNPQGYH